MIKGYKLNFVKKDTYFFKFIFNIYNLNLFCDFLRLYKYFTSTSKK